MKKFRTPYDGVRKRVSVSFTDEHGEALPSMTEQHHKNDCDINTILKRYDKTGLITHVNNMQATYGDFTEVNEYQESLNLVMAAQQSFADLPSNIRKRFSNDPGEFMEFITDPKNSEEMIKLGLATRRVEVAPEVSPAATPSE